MAPPSDLQQTLFNLRELAIMARALYAGIRKAQMELKHEGMNIPKNLERVIGRLEMDLDEIALDLDELTK